MQHLSFDLKVRRSFIYGLLIFLFAFLSYPLRIGGSSIPNFFVLCMIILVLFKYHRCLDWADYKFLISIFTFFIFSIYISFYSGLYIEKYKGLIQIMLSLSVFVISLSVGAKRELISKSVLGYSIILLFAFSLIEIFIPPIRELVDFVRNQIFSENLYTNNIRDINLSGHLRPTLFTSEPSHVTKAFFVLFFSYGIFIEKHFWLKIILLLALGLYVFASPTIILSFLLVLFHRYYDQFFEFKNFGFLKALLLGFVSLLITYILIQYVFIGLQERLVRTINGSDGSFSMRILFPYISVYDVFSNNFYFGIGLSAKEFIEHISSLRYLELRYIEMLGNNAFAHSLVYFGAGSIVFYGIILRFISKKINKPILYTFIITFIFSNNMGGLETPRYWVYLSIMFLAILLSTKEDVQEYTNNR